MNTEIQKVINFFIVNLIHSHVDTLLLTVYFFKQVLNCSNGDAVVLNVWDIEGGVMISQSVAVTLHCVSLP